MIGGRCCLGKPCRGASRFWPRSDPTAQPSPGSHLGGLEVEVREKGALARLEPPPPAARFRMDVGRATTVGDVCEALR